MLTEQTKRKRAERIIRDDIFWVMKFGPGFDPNMGAMIDVNDKWETQGCGVCAIGAVCLRRQPKLRSGDGTLSNEAESTVKILGLTKYEIDDLYSAVGGHESVTPWINKMAERLLRYAASLDEDKLRHEAAQEDQMLAERMGLTR